MSPGQIGPNQDSCKPHYLRRKVTGYAILAKRLTTPPSKPVTTAVRLGRVTVRKLCIIGGACIRTPTIIMSGTIAKIQTNGQNSATLWVMR